MFGLNTVILFLKESTEKKNIRQHVQVEHDAVLEDLEQQHGDCELHTE